MGKGRLVLSLIVGIGMVGLGLYLASSGTATCNGTKMGPDDRCITYSHGSSVSRTADQQLSKDRTQGYILAGVGGLVALASLVLLASSGRRRPAAAYGAAPGAWQQTGQPYGQPMQYPAAGPQYGPQHGAPYPPVPGHPAQPPYPQGGPYPPGPQGGRPPYPGY